MPSPSEQRPTDDLLWLEPPHSADALAWAQEQTSTSTASLQSSETYAQVLEALTQINDVAGQAAPISFAGPMAVRLHKTAQHPKGLLQTAWRTIDGLGPWQTKLDVADLGAREGKTFELHWSNDSCVAPDFERCLLNLHEDGGDEAEYREFDLTAGQLVERGFSTPKSRSVAAWIDPDTILIGHTVGEAPRTATGFPTQALLWKRGEPLAAARQVFEIGLSDAMFLPLPAGQGGRAVIAQVVDYSTFKFHCVTSGGEVRTLETPTAVKMAFGANADFLFLALAAPATLNGNVVPAESLIAARLQPVEGSQPALDLVYRAQSGNVIDTFGNLSVSGDSIALPIRTGIDVRVDVARHENGTWRVDCLVPPRSGVTPLVVGAGGGADGFVIQSSGFLVPPVQEWVRGNGRATTIERQHAMFDTSRLRVEPRQATSRDGQVVDFVLVGPDAKGDHPIPTLMTGYGAFGITLAPGYFTTTGGGAFGGATLKLWLERGGALAVPAIRGGGEHGEVWHQSAIREKRQNSYDDFHCVAESLIRSGYTDRSRLGVFGLSNGGLLSAVVGTQRPDLYGAIVSDVPLADMLRFPEMGMGAAWINEYGDPKNPADAEWLSKYSPVHNVRAGKTYPAFLVTVATSDNRVGPGHARKLAKRLMDANVNTYFLEPEEGGHGVSNSLQQPDVMAMRATFFIDKLIGQHHTPT